MEPAEAGHAAADQVLMARDVATMFDELKAMADRHVELHADRAQLQAELERERTELERAWRRWFSLQKQLKQLSSSGEVNLK
jgi:3-methyladenine DNA glycosylase/8-oxoguanine DNA glycosylase